MNTLQNYILKCTKFQSQQAINQIFLTDVDFLPVIVFLSNYFLKIHYVTLSWLRSKKNKNQREVGEYWLPHFMIVWLSILFTNSIHFILPDILFLALERVPPGYPRRIPLELFSEETLRRIDGLDKEEGNYQIDRIKNCSIMRKAVIWYKLFMID